MKLDLDFVHHRKITGDSESGKSFARRVGSSRGRDLIAAATLLVLLVAAGEYDLPDFRAGSFAASLRAPLELIPGVGHLAPMENPEAFRSLLVRFLA